MRVEGQGLRVWFQGLGFRVEGGGLKCEGQGLRVWGVRPPSTGSARLLAGAAVEGALRTLNPRPSTLNSQPCTRSLGLGPVLLGGRR